MDWATLVFWVLLILTVVFLALFILEMFVRPNSGPHWKQVTGRIEFVGIAQEMAGPEWQVRFSYAVDGIRYQEAQSRFLRQPISKLTRGNFPKTFPVGQAVQVFYDPADPACSVIEPRCRNTAMALGYLGWFVLTALAWLAFAMNAQGL